MNARAFPVFFAFTIILLSNTAKAGVVELNVMPKNPVRGEDVTISGTASPGEEVRIDITFETTVPVKNGEYEFSISGIKIPEKNNRFTVTAYGCLDLDVSARRVIFGSLYFPAWITLSNDARNGMATISQSVPVGTYDVVIHGRSDQSSVRLRITATGYITADESGKFTYTYDTSALPLGEFTITAGGISRTVALSERRSDSPSGASGIISYQPSVPSPTPVPTETQVENRS